MTRAQQIAFFQSKETPFYFYDLNKLRTVLDALDREINRYNYHIHYALKANANPVILSEMVKRGYGADCVSGGEVQAALDAGFAKSQVVFAGVGKSDAEINLALDNDIACFNAESVQELEVINELAEKKGKTANIALRLNPDVDAKTHRYITTGLNENKFGINPGDIPQVIELLKTSKHLNFYGLHFHIGSQITDLSAFKHLCIKANEFNTLFKEHKLRPRTINVGGGLGIDYHHPEEKMIPDFINFFRIFHMFLELDPDQEVHFEPGRSLVANCGELITRVLYIKPGLSKSFAVVDAGMNELIRPALYEAFHKIDNLSNNGEADKKYDVVGPVCETSDTFGKDVPLPETLRGHLITIQSAGAYGEVMAGNYNLRGIVKTYHSDEM